VGACDVNASNKSLSRTERYFIHDGIIDKLPDSQAKTSDAELTELLQTAEKLSPSAKLGLLIQSHGSGSQGIATNKGPVDLDKTLSAIQNGLSNRIGKTLDVLDFDACDMGTIAVLSRIRDSRISNNVVASATAEGSTGDADGQNLSAAFHSLMANTKQTGAELASSFVEHAKEGDNGSGKNNATMTLASFDLTKFDDFKRSLNTFGEELTRFASTKEGLRAIRSIVDSTVRPETGQPDVQKHERDLQSFAHNLLSAIEAGQLHVRNDNLANAAKHLLQSLSEMETNHFGEAARDYKDLAGITANIPGKELLDRHEVGRLLSPFHAIVETVDGIRVEGLALPNKPDIVQEVQQAMDGLSVLKGAPGNWARELIAARKRINSATTESELNLALDELRSAAKKWDSSALGANVQKRAEQEVSSLRHYYQSQRPSSVTPGWDAFIKKMEQSVSLSKTIFPPERGTDARGAC
jgi:hypothetical protein